MKLKKVLSLLLVVSACFSVCAIPASAAQNFSDVPENKWYYNDVTAAVEMGLINGKTTTEYCPDDYLTYGEAIKLAACMNQLYNEGEITFVQGSPWYQVYVDYCRERGIISKEYDYKSHVTRAGYMNIFAKALPDAELAAINQVPDNSIPDVPGSKEYAAGVYKLYRAGILQGVDGEHNCSPLSKITRAEVAAILIRMMNRDKRVYFSMVEEPEVVYVQMYAPDGRSEYVAESEVAKWEAVGWYRYPVCYVYTLYGEMQLIDKRDLPLWKSSGWYTEPVYSVFNSSGKELIFTLSEIEGGASVSLNEALRLASDYARKYDPVSDSDISTMAYLYDMTEWEVREELYASVFCDFKTDAYLIAVSYLECMFFYSVNKHTGAVHYCGGGQEYWRGMISF